MFICREHNLNKELFHILSNGLHCTGTNLLIQYLWLGVQCVVEGKSSDFSSISPQISPGINLELGRLWLSLKSHTIDPRSKPNSQQYQDSSPLPQDFKFMWGRLQLKSKPRRKIKIIMHNDKYLTRILIFPVQEQLLLE